MRCRGRFILLVFVLAIGRPALSQHPSQFYNVDTEKQVEGTIQDVLLEPRYENRAPFLILVLEEHETGQKYKVETSPAWFFDHDFHKGERVKVTGSVYTKDENLYIIARQVQSGGEIFALRDSSGFPNWRGGQMKGKGKRKGRGI